MKYEDFSPKAQEAITKLRIILEQEPGRIRKPTVGSSPDLYFQDCISISYFIRGFGAALGVDPAETDNIYYCAREIRLW